jgi:hypothetical protein
MFKAQIATVNEKFESALDAQNTLKSEIASLHADKLRMSLEIKELESTQSQSLAKKTRDPKSNPTTDQRELSFDENPKKIGGASLDTIASPNRDFRG